MVEYPKNFRGSQSMVEYFRNSRGSQSYHEILFINYYIIYFKYKQFAHKIFHILTIKLKLNLWEF